MAKPTVAILTAENLNLTATIVAMGAEIATLRTQLLNVTSVASAINKAHRAPRLPEPWQVARAEAMAAAKAAAIAGKCVVRV